ncbi:MAG: hypothetical protein GXX85_13635 [Ignavibacteria bacterium]|nr:hypothetical protein [Ignavibacteria bacterium]
MELTINIEVKGRKIGTLGWLESVLADGNFVIKDTKSGVPGMFFHQNHLENGQEAKESEGNIFICRAFTDDEHRQGYEVYSFNSINYILIYAQSTDYIYGFTRYPLTPAANKKLENMLYAALLKYKEWFESN